MYLMTFMTKTKSNTKHKYILTFLSRLRSKTKQQSTSNEQGPLECNPTLADLLECNPAKIQVNTAEIA